MSELLHKEYSLTEIPELIPDLLSYIIQYPIVLLVGEMGAGKTTLIAQLCKALGVVEDTSSPTFSIIQEYFLSAQQPPIYHLDLYRLNELDELLDTGIEEVMDSNNFTAMFIEWPQIAEPILPIEKTMLFQLGKIGSDKRSITVKVFND